MILLVPSTSACSVTWTVRPKKCPRVVVSDRGRDTEGKLASTMHRTRYPLDQPERA